jgi:excinuclease ABC subunit B
MPEFQVVSDFQPTGDQPQAIELLVEGLAKGYQHQTLLGATGTGKTYTVAKVVEQVQRPTLVLVHNKTLAAQLYSEFRDFFPHNAVEYFVSYYDYYQPEAYLPRTDTYIEKDASINDEIDKLRLAATEALLTRRDVIIVASVSAIYSIGSPEEYGREVVEARRGEMRRRDAMLRHLVAIHYDRNDVAFTRGTFRVRGDTVDIFPAYRDTAMRVEFWGDTVERITEIDPLTGEILEERQAIDIYPAKHFVTTAEAMTEAIKRIEAELEERLPELRAQDKLLEAQRLEQRTLYDIEMMREIGYCSGIENYSRHLSNRKMGEPGWTLIDYFPDDYLLVLDESHMMVPQVRGMYNGDRARKEVLVEYGFRLPSALDNRPLQFHEFEERVYQAIYTSATPGPYEREMSAQIVDQIIRPTGLVDPEVVIKPTKGQIDDLIGEIRRRVDVGQRALVTTLTKRMSEDLADYLAELGMKVHYLHSEIQTLERVEILRDLRLGVYDVVVGINLLREGLDLPEVSLVAILDADKEGFLRSERSLIQTVGRAARNLNGAAIMYADVVTDSMRRAIGEMDRRRARQVEFNRAHGIEPRGVRKDVKELIDGVFDASGRGERAAAAVEQAAPVGEKQAAREIKRLEKLMFEHARNLEFEKAARVRDQLAALREQVFGGPGADKVVPLVPRQ